LFLPFSSRPIIFKMRPNRANTVNASEGLSFASLQDKDEDETSALERKIKVLKSALVKERKARNDSDAEVKKLKDKVDGLNESLIEKETACAKFFNENEGLRELLRAEKSRSDEVVKRTTSSSLSIFKLDKDTTELEGQLLQSQADKAFADKQVAILQDKIDKFQLERETNKLAKVNREDQAQQLRRKFEEDLEDTNKKLEDSNKRIGELQNDIRIVLGEKATAKAECNAIANAKSHVEEELAKVKRQEEALILKLTDKEMIIADLQQTLLKKGEESALMAGKLVAFKNQLIDMQRETWEYKMTKKTKFKSSAATLRIRREGEDSFSIQLIDVSSERVFNILELQEVALLQNKNDHLVLNFSTKKDHREIYHTLEADNIVTKLREYMRITLDAAPEGVKATHKRRQEETYYNLASFLGL